MKKYYRVLKFKKNNKFQTFAFYKTNSSFVFTDVKEYNKYKNDLENLKNKKIEVKVTKKRLTVDKY